ncbi:TPA: type IV secretory system conjugative DNA transfer family protein [Vibrio vulnificus]|nr:type IV secretory system conjugative DNA transfer family protein [Vibrio vulnificus]
MNAVVVENVSSEEQATLDALVESAEDVGIANGYISKMVELMEYVESNATVFDALLPFQEVIDLSADLNASEGAYILPGIVDEVNNSSTLKTSTGQVILKRENTTLLLRQQPKPVLRFPNWRDYLLDEEKLSAQSTFAFLPQNSREKKIYQEALRRGFEMGEIQAIEEMKYRLRRAFSDLTGMVRYANVHDSGKLLKPDIAVESYANRIDGNKLSIGIDYIMLDGEAGWADDTKQYSSPFIDGRTSVRKEIQTLLNNGELTVDRINREIIKQ